VYDSENKQKCDVLFKKPQKVSAQPIKMPTDQKQLE